MKKIFFSCLYIIIPIVSIFSQSNYKEGYIITIKKDTVYGLIDFRTDHTNSLLCKFKDSEASPEKIYHPGEIDGYRFIHEGKYYVSKTIVIEGVQQNVFLEYLVQGMLNLYYLHQYNDYYFFENKDGSLVAITKKADVIRDNNKFVVDNRYKGMLTYIFRDCLPLAIKSSKAEFNKESMIVFTKDYHDQMCESGDKCIIFENDYKKKFTKFDFTVYSGFEFDKSKLYKIENSNMLSFSPVIGVGINISSPRLIKSLSIMLDATFSKIMGAYDYSDKYLTYYQYKFSGIKSNFCTGLEYTYDKGKIRPVINAGISHSSFYDLKSTLKTNTQISENVLLLQNSSTGIKTGIGIDYQINGNQFIIVRFLYSRHVNYYDMNNTYQVKLGYKF